VALLLDAYVPWPKLMSVHDSDVYLLLHATVGSIYDLMVLFLFIGGNCGKSIRLMMQTTYS
jgi:hypothetical protein